jgi:hypothetical protein
MPEAEITNSRFYPSSGLHLFALELLVKATEGRSLLQIQERFASLALSAGEPFETVRGLMKGEIDNEEVMAGIAARTILDCIGAHIEREFGFSIQLDDISVLSGLTRITANVKAKPGGGMNPKKAAAALAFILALLHGTPGVIHDIDAIIKEFTQLLDDLHDTNTRSTTHPNPPTD